MGEITRDEILTSKRQKRDGRRRGAEEGGWESVDPRFKHPSTSGWGTKNFAKYFFKYLSRLGGNDELPLSLIPINGEGSQRIIRVENADGPAAR